MTMTHPHHNPLGPQRTPGTEISARPPRSGGPCACGASAFGQPPGLCLTHALQAEQRQIQRMLALAQRGIAEAHRLAARSSHNPARQREAGQWLAEARDDLRDATHRLALLAPPAPAAVGQRPEGR